MPDLVVSQSVLEGLAADARVAAAPMRGVPATASDSVFQSATVASAVRESSSLRAAVAAQTASALETLGASTHAAGSDFRDADARIASGAG